MRRGATSLLALAAMASCRRCEPSPAGPDAAIEAGVSLLTTHADAAGAASVEDASTPAVEVDAAAASTFDVDAGTSSACRLVFGPAEQPFRGPAALAVVGSTLRLVTNDSGKPRIYPVAVGPLPAKGAPLVAPPRPSSFAGMRWPPCELAGTFAYCQAPGGPILRATLGANEADTTSSEHKTIAKSRSGTRIAAAPLAGGHAAVAYLDVRHTTEGEMLQAFVALDDHEPVHLSEEGAGATVVRALPRGDKAAFVYLDTRTSMVPVHARDVTVEGSDLTLGTDAVVFVGGAPERGIDFAAASIDKRGFAFVPMPRETIDFGLAALPIEEPPKDDVTAVWSLYPNGIDPAPVAAASSRDGHHAWVARVRPREKRVGSQRILELGRVDGDGVFSSLGEIASGSGVTDIGLVEDRYGAVWILYGSTRNTWLERRVCPAAPAK